MNRLDLKTDALKLCERFKAAIEQLKNNMVFLEGYPHKILIEGGEFYPGIWLECGPHEGLVYYSLDPNIAVNNHRIFFEHQRPDGCFPCYMLNDRVAFTQIQMVVPIARTACEVACFLEDDLFLNQAYETCSRWDRWLQQHRNTRGTGLCESFCEYDTGHDNSPRWKNLPKTCLEGDCSKYDPSYSVLPYLAPDLSATVYGGRLALAKMARLIGKISEADMWIERAEEIQKAIYEHCFDEDTLCFYDRDSQGNFIKIRGDVLIRVMQEHVPDATLADKIFRHHILNPKGFWTDYPLPSIAANDPYHDYTADVNSWGGPSQALTALRAPLWFEHYGRYGELNHLMKRWVSVLQENTRFGQQIHPYTGKMGNPDSYSPAMLVLVDFTMRLYGIHEDAEHISWVSQLPDDAKYLSLVLKTQKGECVWQQDIQHAVATLNGKELFQVVGTCRILTDKSGKIKSLIGIKPEETIVLITEGIKQIFHIQMNEKVDISLLKASVSVEAHRDKNAKVLTYPV
jgi:hypothetical protein